jgi:ubiquinone/menaquinone biosynthesis C-methylase UbiE
MLSNQQETYNKLNDLFVRSKITFMNHGYSPSYPFLNNDFLKNQASLYINALETIETKDKTLLDIGCGRGGGVEVYRKHLDLKKIYACDLNVNHIEYCINNNSIDVEYKVSDAEKLDYLENQFDIVTSVESSHCYENPNLFFNEVYRVLSPGGTFSYLDNNHVIRYFLNNTDKFKNVVSLDITKKVIMSCEEDIENFKNIDDKEARDLLTSISINARKYYKNNGGKFIKIICNK